MSDRIDVETNELTKNLLKRQDYLVTQGNDLAKAFGNLRALEHKILDYCFSFVAKDSKLDDVFELRILDIVKHLGLNSSGRNYTRVAQGFKVLNESTPLYFLSEDGGIIMTNLFEYIEITKTKSVKFKFSSKVAPYVFDLRQKYYSFHLSELANIKSKYTLVMMKIYQSKKIGDQSSVTIKGDLNEWQDWFLGVNRAKNWTAGRFKDKVLNVATDELSEAIGATIVVNTKKQGLKVVGYEITINTKH